MRHFFRTLLGLTLLGVVLTSCSKSDDAVPEAPVGKLVANANGVSFETDGAAQIYNNVIIIGGVVGTRTLSVTVTKAATVGTYDVKGATLGTTPDAEVNYSEGTSFYSSVFAVNGQSVGTVTITEVDEANKTISGTFSSKTISTSAVIADVTSGTFNKIPYTTTPASTLTTKIDDKAFAATVIGGVTGGGMIVLNGQSLNGAQIITLSMSQTIKAGTYEIGDFLSDAYSTYTVSNETFVSNQGTLTVTTHNTNTKRIEGTFSFTAEPLGGDADGHSFTEGTFAVTYR